MNAAEHQRIASTAYGRSLELSQIKIDDFLHAELGELSFAEFADDFARLRAAGEALAVIDWSAIPGDVVNEYMSPLDNLRSLLDETRSMNPLDYATGAKQGPDFRSARLQLRSRYTQVLPQFWTVVAKVFSFSNGTASGALLTRFENDSQKRLGDLAEEALRFGLASKRAEALSQQLEPIIAAGREAVAKVGVSSHAEHFRQAADQHAKASRQWLWATAVSAVVAVGAAVYNYLVATKPDGAGPVGAAYVTQLVAAKLILFSLLASAVIWCGRVYRSHKHNEVVNRHRQNALSSFETFVAASGSDEQTKNAVLLEATRSIFAPQPTGYTSGESENLGPSQMVEILRTLPGGGAR